MVRVRSSFATSLCRLLAVCVFISLTPWESDYGWGGENASQATAEGRGAVTQTEYRIRGEFKTLHEARTAAEKLRRTGGVVRVRRVTKAVKMFDLRLGPYADRDEVEKIQKRLRGHGVNSQILEWADGGRYAISVGVLPTLADADLLRRELIALRFERIHVIRVATTRVLFVLEEEMGAQSGRPASGLNVEPGRESESGIYQAQNTGTMASPAIGGQKQARLGVGLDTLRAETGWLTHTSQPVYGSHYVRASAHAELQYRHRWEFRVAGRVDGYYQQGSPSVNRTQVDYAPSYIRYDGDSMRVTAGAQTVIWGRMDEFAPDDRLSVQDLSRFILYRTSWRRRAVPEVRVEKYFGSFKADVLWQPFFRPAKLPSPNSIWYPVDTTRGRILSVQSTPILSELVKQGRFAKSTGGAGGVGIRFSGTTSAIDYAFTIQRARRSLPYYKFDPTVRSALLNGADVATAIAASNQTFTEVHPWSWYIGTDAAIDALSATWRVEAAYVSDTPVTTTDFVYTKEAGIDWGAEVEFYPGDSNTRVNIQLSGKELFNPPAVLDRINIYSLGGMIDEPFSHARWRARMRFLFGLDKRNIYLNPELAYAGWEPYEIYLAAHYFAGDQVTAGGYHQNHDMVTLGWRARY